MHELAQRVERAIRPGPCCCDCADREGRCDSGELCDPTAKAKEIAHEVDRALSDSPTGYSSGDDMKDRNLTVEVSDDVLSISIGVEILCYSCEIGRRYSLTDIKITDKKMFVDGIIRQLESEEEDGSTLIHKLFDEAVTEMLENGQRGVDEMEDE